MAQNINLYQGARRRRAWLTRSGLVTIALLFTAGVAGLMQVERQRQQQLKLANEDAARAVARLEKQLGGGPEATQQAVEVLKKSEDEVAALEAVATRLTSGALGRTTGFTAPLRALASSRTDGVWLTGVWFDNNGGQLALEGKAMDAARVPLLIERLRALPQFAGTSIATLDLKPAEEAGKQGPTTLVRFRLATPTVETNGTPTTGAKK